MTQPQFAQYCCSARISPWNDRDGSRFPGCGGSLARRSASAIGWKLILNHGNRFDPRGGPNEGQVEVHLHSVERRLLPRPTETKKARSRGGMPMLAFQVIGWVLILLFFGAMIGSHQRVPDR